MLLQVASQGVGQYTDLVAYSVGLLIVLAALGYVLVTRGVGREDDERAHEKAVQSALDRRGWGTTLTATRQVAVRAEEPSVSQFVDAVGRQVGMRETVGRRERVGQWFRRRLGSLYAHGTTLTDADGIPIYVVSVSGYRLAHRDRELLLVDIERVATALAAGEAAPPTVSEYYYQEIREGRVDLQASRARLRGDCKTRIESNMRRERTLPRSKLVERLVDDFRYPEPVVEQKLSELIERDIREYKDGTLEWQRY